jgi:hypothetical protein
MLHLNLDSMIEALDVLQKERSYVEASLLDCESVTPEFEMNARSRITRIDDACHKLTDALVEAVEEMP